MIDLVMLFFSNFIPETHHNVSPGFVDILIRTHREELFTGLMQLRYPSNEKFILSFVEGIEQQLYRYAENTVQTIPQSAWHQTINRADAIVGSLAFSLEALRVMRIAYEAPIVRAEKLSASAKELLGHAEKWSQDAEPSVAHVQDGQVDSLYLFTNRTGATFESISFTGGKVQYTISDSFSEADVSNHEFQITRYISAQDHAVWREYELRLTFNLFVKMLMDRFSELAGRTLTERLGEQLTLWARGGGWNIALNTNGVIDRHYFDALPAAANAYADILRRFQLEASPAIGSRLADGISREVLFKLDAPRRELFTQQIFTQQMPVGAAVK